MNRRQINEQVNNLVDDEIPAAGEPGVISIGATKK